MFWAFDRRAILLSDKSNVVFFYISATFDMLLCFIGLDTSCQIKQNLKVDYLDIIPFNDDYNIHADINDTVLYYGSQTVIDSLKNKNYKPIGFTNNMNFTP